MEELSRCIHWRAGCSEFTNGDGQLQERRAKDFLVVGYWTPVGNAAACYPETNPLVPLEHTAAKSNTPVSKAIIKLEASFEDGAKQRGNNTVGRATARSTDSR